MKMNYRLLYVLTLMIGFLVSCDEDESVDPDAEAEIDGMYFPPAGNDAWKTATVAEIGWDSVNLNEAIRYAKEKESYNLMIIHNGKIVVEEYWKDTNASSSHPLNSVSKSFMAFVIGVLQEEGKLSIDDKVSDYLDAGWSQSPETESEITIRHLITMTSGLNDGLQFAAVPDAQWYYSHDAYKVLHGVISKAGGTSYHNVFESVFMSRIGIENFTWVGRELSSTPREIAKFGLMILNRGVWKREQLIHDGEYFNAMTNTSQSLQQAYGYLWWLNGKQTWYDVSTKATVNGFIVPSAPADALLAKGRDDQRIYVVPSLGLVVIRQGLSTGLPEAGEGSFDDELWKRIMVAVNGGVLGG